MYCARGGGKERVRKRVRESILPIRCKVLTWVHLHYTMSKFDGNIILLESIMQVSRPDYNNAMAF